MGEFVGDLVEAVDRAADLKARITELTAELRRVNLVIAEKATYKEGQVTGHAAGLHWKAKVQLRENVKWDQDKLEVARGLAGDDKFFSLFKFKYEPMGAKEFQAGLGGCAPELAKAISAARTATPGAPAVTFEALED